MDIFGSTEHERKEYDVAADFGAKSSSGGTSMLGVSDTSISATATVPAKTTDFSQIASSLFATADVAIDESSGAATSSAAGAYGLSAILLASSSHTLRFILFAYSSHTTTIVILY